MNKASVVARVSRLERWAIASGVLASIGGVGALVCGFNWATAKASERAALCFTAVAAIFSASAAMLTVFAWRQNGTLRAIERQESRAQELAIEAARKEAERAGERAAVANQLAESERLERLKIEERLADRAMTDEQVAEFTGKMTEFAGQRLFVLATRAGEPAKLGNQIVRALLNGSGWRVGATYEDNATRVVLDLLVEVVQRAEVSTTRAALALAAALRAGGLSTRGPEPMPDDAGSATIGGGLMDADIRLTIGTKA